MLVDIESVAGKIRAALAAKSSDDVPSTVETEHMAVASATTQASPLARNPTPQTPDPDMQLPLASFTGTRTKHSGSPLVLSSDADDEEGEAPMDLD